MLMQTLWFKHNVERLSIINFDFNRSHFQNQNSTSSTTFSMCIFSFRKILSFLALYMHQAHVNHNTAKINNIDLPPPRNFLNCSICYHPVLYRCLPWTSVNNRWSFKFLNLVTCRINQIDPRTCAKCLVNVVVIND